MKTQVTWWLPTALILICFGVLLSAVACTSSNAKPSSGAFVTVWKGVAGEPLKIPIVGNYTVTWYEATTPQDRHTETVSIIPESDTLFTHPYTFTPPRDGEYVVEAGPEGVEYMRMTAGKHWESKSTNYWTWGYYIDEPFCSNLALLRVLQFGNVKWKSMKGMFVDCPRMNFADTIDTPDLAAVRDMQLMFYGCQTFNSPLEHWDVSKVENMRSMFSECAAFNQPLAGWDVSHMTDMSAMFVNCSLFNQPLEAWDVSRVTDMSGMFAGCTAFNQPLERWNVGRVETMDYLLADCYAFNQPLERWDVSHVRSMGHLFSRCGAFNQPLAGWLERKPCNRHERDVCGVCKFQPTASRLGRKSGEGYGKYVLCVPLL